MTEGNYATLTIMPTADGRSTSLFQHKSPKPEGIKAVKLTEANLQEVAAYVLKVYGHAKVVEGGIFPCQPPADWVSPTFPIGNWIVEEYDYSTYKTRLRSASADERERYDLR